MKKIYLLVILVGLFAVLMTGCGETYDIEADTEFHVAADKAIEECLRGGDIEAIFDNLFEQFSDRYSTEKMDEFTAVRFTKVDNELNAKLDGLNQKAAESKVSIDEGIKKLESVNDKAVFESLLEKMEMLDQREQELNEEFGETKDLYRMIEIQEELVTLYDDCTKSIDEAVN